MRILGPDNTHLTLDEVAKLPEVPAPREPGEQASQRTGEELQPDVLVRPSLDVAIDSHKSISQRIHPFLLRLRSWSLKKLSPQERLRFVGVVEDMEAAWSAVLCELDTLKKAGFVAKTTQNTRLAASLRPGDPISLSPELHVDFRQLYNEDELANLKVVRVTSTHAIVTGQARELGPIKLCHIVPKITQRNH